MNTMTSHQTVDVEPKVLVSRQLRADSHFASITALYVSSILAKSEINLLVGPDGQLYAIPFAKSAVTEQQCPVSDTAYSLTPRLNRSFQDNTRYAFLQMDDQVMVYRGADQPDMSVINPESDVWQHIQVGID